MLILYQMFNKVFNKCSEWISPEGNFLLFKIAPVLFINKNKIEEIFTAETIVDINIWRGKVRLSEV